MSNYTFDLVQILNIRTKYCVSVNTYRPWLPEISQVTRHTSFFFWIIYVLRWPAWSLYMILITVAILAQGKPSGYSTTLAVLLNRFMDLGKLKSRLVCVSQMTRSSIFFFIININYVLRWPALSLCIVLITVAILAQGKPSGYSTTLAVLLNRFMDLGKFKSRLVCVSQMTRS